MVLSSFARWLTFRRPTITQMRRLSRTEFSRCLDRERQRADRSGGFFSLVHFQLLPDAAVDAELCRALDKRLRQTDDYGDYADGIGVILPGTPLKAACNLARQIVSSSSSQHPIRWRCYEYPSGNSTSSAEAAGTDTNSRTPSADERTLDVRLPVSALFVKPLPRWKRAIDICLALLLLVATAPIILIAAVAIKCTSPGPIFFCQRRMGLGGRPFVMYKLRTMHVHAEAQKAQLRPFSDQDGPAFKMKNDPRVTKVGKYLRKTCIDELPQLWNVLRGDMTLVGPRPLPCDEQQACAQWQQQRLDVTPGLTCIWQASSGKERVPFQEWMRMDLRYARNRSLWQDLKLLGKTLWAVIRHRASH